MPWDGSEEDPGECLSGRTTLFGFVVDVDGLREMSIGLHSPFHAEWFYQAVQIGVTADFCGSLGGHLCWRGGGLWWGQGTQCAGAGSVICPSLVAFGVRGSCQCGSSSLGAAL